MAFFNNGKAVVNKALAGLTGLVDELERGQNLITEEMTKNFGKLEEAEAKFRAVRLKVEQTKEELLAHSTAAGNAIRGLKRLLSGN